MGVLVDHDTGVERAVPGRGGLGPDVHAHTGNLAIGWREEVGVVGTGSVLSVELDEIAAVAAGAGPLEVASGLVETKEVKQVVVDVGGVEELGQGSIAV